MQVSITADAKHAHYADMSEPIRCALVEKPTRAQKYKEELVRYAIVVIAILAVLLLIAIAFYYTEGNSVLVKHVSSLVPYLSRTRLS